MAVTLFRAYGGFASGAVVTFPDATEQSLIAQGLANGVNILTGFVAGTFGVLPATITVPTTFTTAQGFIFQLYT